MRRSPGTTSTPWGPSPSSPTFITRVTARKTARSPSSSWGWPRLALWPTNSSRSEARFNLKPVFCDPISWVFPKSFTAQCSRSATAPAATKSPALWPTPSSILRKSHLSSGGKMNGQPFGSPRGCWLARPTSERQLDSFLSLWRSYVGGWSGCWNTLVAMADSKLSALYYSPRGYWKGLAAIEKLASAAKVTEQQAKDWLKRQAIWQIYLPAPRRVPRPKFDVALPNEVHQADLLFLPHDLVGRKTYRYALTVVDVASRYKEAEPLTSKTAAEVADGLARIYKWSPLRWPKLLQVDPGREFMGAVS